MIRTDLCNCGAVTLEWEDGSRLNMPLTMFTALFPGATIACPTFYACDYCSSHYGVDLCGCGSGQKVGQCDGYNYHCRHKVPAQFMDDQMIEQLRAIVNRKYLKPQI